MRRALVLSRATSISAARAATSPASSRFVNTTRSAASTWRVDSSPRLRPKLRASTTETTASSRTRSWRSGRPSVQTRGNGSARPEVSKSTRSRSPRPLSSRIAATRSGLRTQQAQPSLISTRASVAGASSIPATPLSFWRTPIRRPPAAASRRFRSVVLPAPRKPVTTVTGSGEATPPSVRGRRASDYRRAPGAGTRTDSRTR